MTQTATSEKALSEREVLRQASVALQGRTVTMWEVVAANEARPVLTSQQHPPYHQTTLDMEGTLQRWHVDIVPGSRWVGCKLEDADGRWCVAPVRRMPPAPPPSGRERRSRERMTLELAGLCMGLLTRPRPALEAKGTPASGDGGAVSAGVIAHEVSNPLGAARVTIDFCLETLQGAVTLEEATRREMVEDLTIVAQAIDRAVSYLRSMRDRARVSVPRIERFDAVKVAHSCLTLEGPLAKRRGVRLELASGVEQVYLQGDPNGLYQIIVNLVRNAVDASEGSGEAVMVSVEQLEQTLQLAVRDRGVGIFPDQLDRIFEPGFTTKPFGAGAGMGLSVVRDAARTFGGTVRVDSVPGEGTAVIVEMEIPPQRSGDAARRAQGANA